MIKLALYYNAFSHNPVFTNCQGYVKISFFFKNLTKKCIKVYKNLGPIQFEEKAVLWTKVGYRQLGAQYDKADQFVKVPCWDTKQGSLNLSKYFSRTC